MQNIQYLVEHYGSLFYIITFFWALIEGETFLIFAGFFVSQGYLSLPWLIVAAGLGTTVGDFGCFWLGRKYGTKLVAKMPKLAAGQAKVIGWIEKHDVGFILAYRFIYGLRNISAIAIGTSHISWQRYLFLNFCGAFVWAISFACGGYLFGGLLARPGEDPVAALMKGVLGIIIVIVVIRFIMSRRKASKGAAETQAVKPVASAEEQAASTTNVSSSDKTARD